MPIHGATRILAFVATALAVTSTAAGAQATSAAASVVACGSGTSNPKCQNVPRVRSHLFDGIELTKAQQDSIDALTRRYLALATQVIRQNLPVEAHNAQMTALREHDIAEKRKVMTPAQRPRFDANAAALKKRDQARIEETRRRMAERQKRRSGGTTP